MSGLAAKWYVVRTRPNAEAKAATHLRRQGFEVYLPRYRKRRSHARKIEEIAAPLFPGYLFVAIDVGAQRWRAIQSTVGVCELVCHGIAPAPLPAEIIAMIKAREDDHGLVHIASRRFIAGEKLRVMSGAFADTVGLFEDLDDRNRVALLLDCLGRKVRVSIDAALIEAA